MKVKSFIIENSGGNIFVAWGEFDNGTYFSIGSDLLMVFDENEYMAMESDDFDGYTWEENHTINSYSYTCEEYLDVLKQLYKRTSIHSIDLFNEIEKD